MHDHHWLYNAPPCPGAVQWSEDNHLAIAAAYSVVVLNPGHLNGPRGVAVGPQGCFFGAVSVDVVPREWQNSFQLIYSVATEVKAGDQQKQNAPVRAVGWSPAGCSVQAGCLLTTVTADHQVRRPGARTCGRLPSPPALKQRIDSIPPYMYRAPALGR